jgi:putative hydrolase of the HAD superfamily
MPDRTIEGILFDLDETLYPSNIGLMQAIGHRIHAYMEVRMGLGAKLASSLRKEYYRKYGTSLRGLQIHHAIDPEDYLAFVHDIELTQFVVPNPALKTMLDRVGVRKVIFTNATTEHALNVTRVLGIDSCFERIIDVRANDYVGKPYPEAYAHAVNLLGIPAQNCLLVEDNVRNLRPGKDLGMVTVLVGNKEAANDSVDFHVNDILHVARVLHELGVATL